MLEEINLWEIQNNPMLAKQYPELSENMISILKVANETYSPNTSHIIEQKFPIFIRQQTGNIYAQLATDLVTGIPLAIYLKPKSDLYVRNRDIEHEGIHLKQAPVVSKFKSMTFVLPSHAFKLRRVVELEAYLGETYKFVRDYTDNKVPLESKNIILNDSLEVVHKFLEVNKGKSFEYSWPAVIYELDSLKDSKQIKSLEELAPNFYFSMSQSLKYMYTFSNHQIRSHQNIFEQMETVETEELKEILQEKWQEAADIGKKFTIEHAGEVLGRDGLNPIDQMDNSQRRQFWQSICFLEKGQQLQIEQFRQQVNKYIF